MMDSQRAPNALIRREELIAVEGVSAGFESRTVLKDVTISVPTKGLLALIGPAGVGKSTLLRTLARWNEQLPAFWVHGTARLDGKNLFRDYDVEDARRQVALLAQKARLFTATVEENAIDLARPQGALSIPAKRNLARSILERVGLSAELGSRLSESVTTLSIAQQRKLGMARLLGGGARCLLVDEPFRDIQPDEIEDMMTYLERISRERAVVMVTHDQRKARRLASEIALLVDGQVIEAGPAAAFFAKPTTRLGAQYLRDGNCWFTESEREEQSRRSSRKPEVVPGPESSEVPEEEREPWRPSQAESVPRPGGFHWIIPGLLGGMQRPGLLREEADDLRGLNALGVQYLVSLTEEPFDQRRLAAVGIIGVHFPIVDMGTPKMEDAYQLCSTVSRRIEAQLPTVLHCKAGLGRTGTMLACVRVFQGLPPVRAIHEIRQINPLYIQSTAQLEFVPQFAEWVAQHNEEHAV